jgi:hypothetical protein
MGGQAARRAAAACVVALAGLTTPPAWSAPVNPSPCTALALSPTFATDKTAVCAGMVYEPSTGSATAAAVFVTTDKGKSWRKATAAGIAITRPDDYLRGVVLSPRYATDHMIFVQVARAGLYASTDLGETFTLVSPLGLGRVTPYVATPALLADLARPLLLHADAAGNDVSMQVDPTSHAVAPVPGTPGADREFAVSPRYATDGIAFAAGRVIPPEDKSVSYPTVFACATGFACTETRFTGPKYAMFERLWVLPAATPSGFVVVLRLMIGSTPRLWRSTDGGHAFLPWTSLNAIGATIGGDASAHLDVTADPVQPKRMYLRASWTGNTFRRGSPPNEQLFVSEDAGGRWTRVSWGTMNSALHHVGPIPEMAPPADALNTPVGFVAAGGGGRLFMLAGSRGLPGYTGPVCSRDGGKTWARFCAS